MVSQSSITTTTQSGHPHLVSALLPQAKLASQLDQTLPREYLGCRHNDPERRGRPEKSIGRGSESPGLPVERILKHRGPGVALLKPRRSKERMSRNSSPSSAAPRVRTH